jgi:hypothetical protein
MGTDEAREFKRLQNENDRLKRAVSDLTLDKLILYRLWDVIRAESGITEFPEDYTYYSLRHTYTTYRLQLGNVDVFTLSKVMGCSVYTLKSITGRYRRRR